jgi:hypothetical protein
VSASLEDAYMSLTADEVEYHSTGAGTHLDPDRDPDSDPDTAGRRAGEHAVTTGRL